MSTKNKQRLRPVFIFDGDCFFCRIWMAFFQSFLSSFVDLVPLQRLNENPRNIQISPEHLKKSVHLVTPENEIFTGASAFIAALRWNRDLANWGERIEAQPWLMKLLNRIYILIANNRSIFTKITQLFWGKGIATHHRQLSYSFVIRGVGFIFFLAFLSLRNQTLGLFGSQGIFPAAAFLDNLYREIGSDGIFYLPSIFWHSASDSALALSCNFGILAGLLIFLGILPGFFLFCASVVYLSFISIGGEFMRFQWDSLLVEAGFLFSLAAPWSRGLRNPKSVLGFNLFTKKIPAFFHFLVLLLLFRLWLGAGVVKWFSGDPAWRDFTALSFHFQTQPLPTPLAPFFHFLTPMILKFFTALTLLIELALPPLIFFPRRFKLLALIGFLALQFVIALTGNFAFFNWLTAILSLAMLEDRQWRWVLARIFRTTNFFRNHYSKIKSNDSLKGVACGLYALVAVPTSLFILDLQINQTTSHFMWVRPVALLFQNYSIINPYGLFAVMTKERREITLEVSGDGKNWKPLAFQFKPNNESSPLHWVSPHQPRIDWQMWFAALDQNLIPERVFKELDGRSLDSTKRIERYFKAPTHLPIFLRNLAYRIQNPSPDVLKLFANGADMGAIKKLRFRVWHYDYSNTNQGPRWFVLELNRFEFTP